MEVKLKYCTYEIWRDDVDGTKSVRTIFPDGLSCGATRDEKDPLNIQEAVTEGYSVYGRHAVWRSLIDHEFLHSLMSEILFDRPSLVLREQAGDNAFVPARIKYEEEILVLFFQEWLNGVVDSDIKYISREKCLEIQTRYYQQFVEGSVQWL